MSGNIGPNIIEDGLVLLLDAANKKSYPGSGTTWYDLSGNGLNSTLTNGPTYSSNNGGFIKFDGIDDFSTITSLTAYSHTQAHTYEVFANVQHIGGGYRWILNNGGSSGGTSLMCQTNSFNGVLPGFFYDGGNAIRNMTDGGVNKLLPFGFHHFATIYNGNQTVTFYADGIEYDTVTTPRTWTATNLNPRIGSWQNGSFDCKMELPILRVYNRAVTIDELIQNYNTIKSRFL